MLLSDCLNYVGVSEFHGIKYLLAQKESVMHLYYPINSKMCLAGSLGEYFVSLPNGTTYLSL